MKYTKDQLIELLKYTICKKGCGEVEIVKYYNSLICVCCGEELEFPTHTEKFLLTVVRKIDEEE